MTKAQALATIGQAINAANAAGNGNEAGALATLYYKVTTVDWDAPPVMH
jgi:hypothetical protein